MPSKIDPRSRSFDGALALLLAALNLSILIPLSERTGLGGRVVGVLVTVHAFCLVWRRVAPTTVLAVNAVTGAAVLMLGYPSVVLGVASLVAVYTMAASEPRRASIPTVALVACSMVVASALGGSDIDLGTLGGNVAVLGVMWFLGDSVRQRRDYVRRLEERTSELERARDELARAAVAEERLRISRELHDILGHSVGVIAVQAGVGAHVIDDDPAEAKRSLQAIEAVSKTSLDEIRRVVGALREPGAAADFEPMPGLARLSALTHELPPGGPAIDFQVDADAETIAPGLQLTIYRIVQEALTNVLRHSGARRARVSVRSTSEEVRVEVVDDGAGMTGGTGGHGLLGMQERASIHGGTFEAGALPDQGFRVRATFPLGGTR